MLSENPPLPHIVIAVGDEPQFKPILQLGYALAKAQSGKLTVLYVDADSESPSWLRIPSKFEDIEISLDIIV